MKGGGGGGGGGVISSGPPGVSLSLFGPHTALCSLCLKWKISVTQYPSLIPTDSQIIIFFLVWLKYDFMCKKEASFLRALSRFINITDSKISGS